MLNNNLERQNQALRNRVRRFFLYFLRVLLICATLFFIVNHFVPILPIVVFSGMFPTSLVIAMFLFMVFMASFIFNPDRSDRDPGPGGGPGGRNRELMSNQIRNAQERFEHLQSNNSEHIGTEIYDNPFSINN